jgi:hypothetical protein
MQVFETTNGGRKKKSKEFNTLQPGGSKLNYVTQQIVFRVTFLRSVFNCIETVRFGNLARTSLASEVVEGGAGGEGSSWNSICRPHLFRSVYGANGRKGTAHGQTAEGEELWKGWPQRGEEQHRASGAHGSGLLEALRYRPEGRGFETRRDE